MNKRLTLILTLLVLAVMSLSIASAVNDTSDDIISADNDDKLEITEDLKLSDDTQDGGLSPASDDLPVAADGVEVKVVWDDDSKMPDSIKCTMTVNEDPMEIDITKEMGWIFRNPDAGPDDSIQCSAEDVPGYTVKVTGSAKTGFTITYTLKDKPVQNTTDNSTASDDTATTGDDTKDTPEKTTTTKTVTKTVTKKAPANNTHKNATKDKHNTGNPILLGVLAISAAGAVMHIRRRK